MHVLGSRTLHPIDHICPERVITAIDKDYNLVGQTVTKKLTKDPRTSLPYNITQVEQMIYPKANDPAQISHLNIKQYKGLGSQPNPGEDDLVVSKHYISRIALEPEKEYYEGKYNYHTYKKGNRIYEEFHFTYYFKDRNGNLIMRPFQIDEADISGGETFYTRVSNMIKKWREQHKVIRNESFCYTKKDPAKKKVD